jgi:two-component system phosphate regulon sensor histidine kinase PhoR
MQPRPYFTRLLAVSLALLFGAAVFIFYQTSYNAQAVQLEEFREREANTLRVVEWLVASKAPYSGAESLRGQIGELSKRFGIRITYIEGGKVLAESDLSPAETEKMEDHSTRPEVMEAKKTGFGASNRYSSTLQTEMLYVAASMKGTAGLPDGVLRIAVPYSAVQKSLSDSRSRFLAVVASMALCAVALAVFLVRRTQTMLRSFSQVVDDLGREESPDKIRVYPGTEFKPLADSINLLAKRARKHMRHLHETRCQYEAVLGKMTDAVAVLDQDGVILAHNAALEALLGEPALPPAGRNVLEAGLGLAVHNAVREGATAVESTEPRRFVTTLLGGRIADVDLVPYVTAKGKPRLILVLHDITAMKNAELILREFVINASHQLRTPLTSIQGYAATLLESPPEDLEQAHGMLATILRKSQDMSAVVTELLDTAAPQAESARRQAS